MCLYLYIIYMYVIINKKFLRGESYEDIYKKNSIKEILKHHAKDTPKEFLAIVEECQC